MTAEIYCGIILLVILMMSKILDECRFIFDKLEGNGYECFAVGGCVRDVLLGNTPNDIDFTTNALPDEILNCFREYKTFELGKKFGTISVLNNNRIYEITTYRIDGEYTDSRHPDKVEFSRNLKDDLLRRDFTINALAMDRDGNITDYYGGLDDLNNRIIKAVGNPYDRFGEDALRIFRAVRFSAKLGFTIESQTASACLSMAESLRNVHPQRIRDEFSSLVLANNAGEVISEYRDIISVIIPELAETFDFQQITAHHRYDVFTHTIKALSLSPQDLEIRLALLFHDVAKPQCHFADKAGISHFKGHPSAGAKIAKTILKRFSYPSALIEKVCYLIEYHDKRFEKPRPHIKRILAKIGEEGFEKLLVIQKCDALAQSEYLRDEKLRLIENVSAEYRRIISEEACIKLADLDINGNDLINLGFSGREIGKALDYLLQEVVYDRLINNKEVLIKAALILKEN